MKIFRKYMQFLGAFLALLFLNGCAAGSATAGYAIKAREADHLTAEGEQRIIDRAKREVMIECYGIQSTSPCAQEMN